MEPRSKAIDPARDKLTAEGYCVLEGVLDPALLAEVRAISARALASVSAEHRARNKSQGSLINISDHPGYAALIGHDGARRTFQRLGFADPCFSSGYLISKPPAGPPLFWHQDWWGWDDPLSYSNEIAQIFFMYYLTDTAQRNGCLRVLPGSHRRPHPLHKAIQAHDADLSRVEDPDDPLYGPQEGEVPVPVRAGDLVVGDARLLHSAHGNDSDDERSLITLWYHPQVSALPAGMRARIRAIFERREVDTDPGGAEAMTLDDWPESERSLVADLLPPPEPGVAPHNWNRVPNWQGNR